MAKLKGFDFKTLLLNHGEKFVTALIALLGVSSLATANWHGSEKQPEDLKKEAEATRSAWLANPFTEDKKAAFEDTKDVLVLAERMQSETEDQEKYSTLTPWNPPIYPVRERRGAVTVLAPTDPESGVVGFVIAEKPDEMNVDPELALNNEPEEIEKGKKSEISEEAEQRFGIEGSGLGGLGTGPSGLGGPGFGAAAMRGAFGVQGQDYDEMEPSQMGYGAGAYGGTLAATMERKVHYHSGVSVRMIFPLLEQIRTMAQSLHLPANDPQVAAAVDFVGFQIERKRAVQGADPWAGNWESISTDEIGEVLETSLGFDLDVVSPGVTRSELTMPLPRLAAGKWTAADVSHKKLEDFKLDEKEQELVDLYQAKMLEEFEKRKKVIPVPVAKRGFTRYMMNASQLNQAVDVDDSGQVINDIVNEIAEDEKSGNGRANGPQNAQGQSRYQSKEELQKLINRSMAAGRLLLVRFMDLTCDRGNTYIYRVRLEMNNPNFRYPVDALEQPELSTQATIFSDWSVPTAPTYVPQSYRYYTKSVDNPNSVKIGMYYENEKTGTPVMANLEVRVGCRVGGRSKIEVVDLTQFVLEPQDVELKSPDVLAAVSPSLRLNSSDSPELKSFIDSVRGRKHLADRITVIDNNGAIVTRFVGDTVTNGDRIRTENDDQRFYQDVLKIYEHLKPVENTAAGPYNNVDDESGTGFMGNLGGGGGFGGNMRRGNALSGGGKRSGRMQEKSIRNVDDF